MNISIVIPIFNPNRQLLNKIEKVVKSQKFSGKIELIKVDKGLGLAESLNYGIKRAKYDIIVTLHQDCVPENELWIKTLLEPLENKEYVASVSKVYLPYEFWKEFDFFSRILTIKEQRVITPLLDGKGCAYKKKALFEVGLFDEEEFRTAGEDFDIYLKIKKEGGIAYPNCKVLHYHKYTGKNRLKKEIQLSEGFGVLVRKYKIMMPKYLVGLIKSIPILGWPIFLLNFPYRRWFLGGLFWIPFSLIVNFIYSYGFWKGFLRGKQIVRI